MVEISSATAILSPLGASVAAFWAAVGVVVPSSLAEGLSSFAEVNSMVVDVIAMIAVRVGAVVWWAGLIL